MEELYKRMFNRVSPSPALMEAVRVRAERVNQRHWNRPLAVIFVLCLCAAVSVSVLGATVPSFNRLLTLIAPELAQFLQPVELSCEENGIRMEVVAAMNDEDTAVVYLTMRDLTDNRIDRTIDLYDYNIMSFQPGSYNASTCELTDYDENTGVATFRLLSSGDANMAGKKAVVSVTSFLSHKTTYRDIPVKMNIPGETVETLPLNMTHISGGGGLHFEELEEEGIIQVLKPVQGRNIRNDISFAKITGMGWVDDRFHVQLQWEESVDNHGFLTLRNEDQVIYPDGVHFDVAEGKTVYGRRYQENLFDISPGDLSQYSLWGEFVENGAYTEGNWKVSFQLQKVDEAAIVKYDLHVGDVMIERLTVTPMGIRLTGDAGLEELEIQVVSGGKTVDCDVRTSYRDGGASLKWIPELPINLQEIQELKINGATVPLK